MDPSDAAYRADKLVARKKQRGFIDFAPVFLGCFIAGVLVGLALPWIFKLVRILIIWMAGVLS